MQLLGQFSYFQYIIILCIEGMIIVYSDLVILFC